MKLFLKRLTAVLAFVFMFECFNFNMAFAAVGSGENAPGDLTPGKVYSGFKLQSKNYIKDIDSTVYEFEHEKTGGKICYIKNNDNYRVFSIGFKTLAKDNTGVNHILEHIIAGQSSGIVAEGNADTRDTSTSYYNATSNENDFEACIKNVMSAAFFPSINENLMKQEGWRYEISSPQDELKVNGVVYNEMKGRKSPYDALDEKISSSLFPDLAQFDAGGKPEDIPKLTYNELLETYKKYYTPSNSFVYLYGNIDIAKILQYINDNCFSKFNKTAPVDTAQKDQKVCDKMTYAEGEYSLPKGSSTKNKTYLALNYVLGSDADIQTKNACCILQDIIFSALEKAFLDNGLGKPLYSNGNIYSSQFPLSIIAEGADESQKQKFQTVVDSTLKGIVKNGLSKDVVDSVFNEYEMYYRGIFSSAKRGTKYMRGVMESWSTNGDIEQSLLSVSQIENIREKYQKGSRYFENMIQKYMLNNPHSSLVVINPKPGLDDENQGRLKESLAKYKASLTSGEINELINQDKAFKSWQDNCERQKSQRSSQNSQSLDNMNRKAEEIPTEVMSSKGAKILKHFMYTGGIQYANLYFDTGRVPQDKLMYLVLLTDILGKVNTEKYTYDELSNALNNYGIAFSVYVPGCIICDKDSDKYYPELKVSMSALGSGMKNSFDTLQQIVKSSSFSDKKRLKKLIAQVKSNMQSEINNDSYPYVANESLSYNSDCGKYYNISCIPFYNFICNLDKNFDKQSDEVVKNLNYVMNLAFNKDNLTASYTGDNLGYGSFIKCFDDFSNKIKSSGGEKQKYTFDYSVKNEAFITPAQVQCIVKSGNYRKLGYKPSGKMMVLRTILKSYLRQQLRVKGGAYSVGAEKDNIGFSFYSTSDPNLKDTIDVFDGIPSYLKNFNADKDKMSRYILGSLSYVDTLLDPKSKGSEADDMYIMGITQEDVQKYRDEIFSTTAEDIRNYAPMMDGIIKQDNICVSGNENAINSNKVLFQSIKNLCGR